MPKYRVSANLVWDVEALDVELAEQKAADELTKIANQANVQLLKYNLGLNKLKDNYKPKDVKDDGRDGRRGQVLAEFIPDEIFKQITRSGIRQNFVINDNLYEVKLNSQRYFTFAENRKCVACGIEGTKMFLELPKGCQYPHFNLYGEEKGQLVLITKDHKIPVARNGPHTQNNFQTMCKICNNIKGEDIIHLDDLRKLREMHNKAVENMNSSDLHHMLADEKIKLMSTRIADSVVEVVFDNTKVFALCGIILMIITVMSWYSPFHAFLGVILAVLGLEAGLLYE